MQQPITDEEFGRRLSAARGYSPKGRSQKAFAEFVGIKRDTLARYEAGALPTLSRPGLREIFTEKTGLPKEFFTIDFNDLPKMAEAWRQVEGGEDGALEAEAEAADQETGSLGDAAEDHPGPEQGRAADG